MKSETLRLHRKIKQRESEIEMLQYIINSLCSRELNADGRKFIQKIITEKRHDIRNISNEIRVGKDRH